VHLRSTALVKRKADLIMTERVTDVFWTVLAIAGAECCYGIIGRKHL
jgi:hypothetical protein